MINSRDVFLKCKKYFKDNNIVPVCFPRLKKLDTNLACIILWVISVQIFCCIVSRHYSLENWIFKFDLTFMQYFKKIAEGKYAHFLSLILIFVSLILLNVLNILKKIPINRFFVDKEAFLDNANGLVLKLETLRSLF